MGIISGRGSFAVQFGDHLRSWDHLRTRTALPVQAWQACNKRGVKENNEIKDHVKSKPKGKITSVTKVGRDRKYHDHAT